MIDVLTTYLLIGIALALAFALAAPRTVTPGWAFLITLIWPIWLAVLARHIWRRFR